jgi:predicted alpha/beta superfamily hydrolase
MPRKYALLSLLFILCFSLRASGQAAQASVIHNVHTIQSQVLGEQRTVLVRLPAGYARGNTKFPVAYMLDAHPPQNSMMAGILDQQAWGGQMPEMILVGIQNIDRGRDMTPTATDPGSGGGDKFLQFIAAEVIPLVDKTYRTQPFRLIAGHSLGGLFVVHCLASRPDLFNAYIAASPVLRWDKNFVIKEAQAAFEKNPGLKKFLYVGLGNEPELLDGYNDFKELLTKRGPKKLDFAFQQFEDENHGSVVLPAYYAGLRMVFKGWEPPPTGVVSELEIHYKKLSERLNYTVTIPEELLNRIGYVRLRDGQNEEALAAFRKNVELYPGSPNVYDSLAEALEKTGQLKKAGENYEKAYKMAEAAGEAALAKSARANYERIANKIK